MRTKTLRSVSLEVVAILVALVVFVVPFVFMFLTASKDEFESADLKFSLPTDWAVVDNIKEAFAARDGMLLTAFKNSTILTVVSVAILVVLCSMVGYVIQRRPGRVANLANILVISGLIIPPAVVPTIWVLQQMHLFKTLPGLILVEVAYQMAFCVLLFRAFVAAIPRELDEAAMIDGCTGLNLFFRVIFPLLRPVTITVILTSSVFIYSDFVNPLYFLPGDENATVQLTLFNFLSQFSTQYNLLFMDIVLVTLPPLVLFIFFNRKIVAGMTSGAVKG
ncbi:MULTISPECIES: carbohydrate ABC transporter permease [unclassified Phycicoccus]|uniref:carbohydrate ABC transporter permease n=1 Tax=unclassified Phycicoccus TaxID=2637926 RepID=UPI0007038F1B|nr:MULTISPECIES: carbohydrate ABC transporter permease [unclassified Phycicoccus]KRF22934.1 ABC transporter [Phycicoccus sp. Soil802]KRF24339.1 ABC transporter [Phycicoccus sp. Soil803]